MLIINLVYREVNFLLLISNWFDTYDFITSLYLIKQYFNSYSLTGFCPGYLCFSMFFFCLFPIYFSILIIYLVGWFYCFNCQFGLLRGRFIASFIIALLDLSYQVVFCYYCCYTTSLYSFFFKVAVHRTLIFPSSFINIHQL